MSMIFRVRWDRVKAFYFREGFAPYVLIVPITLALLLIFIYPLLNGLYLSFFDKHGMFIGTKNYVRLFHDTDFWHAIALTFIYVTVYTVGVFLVGFSTALICDTAEKRRMRGVRLLEYFITFPYAIPDVVAALIWFWIFDYRLGIMNYVLQSIGISPVQWLTNPKLALYSVLLATIWRLFPLHTLIILAAFKTVPQELYEAAEIDGASALRKFFQVTLPATWKVISLLLLLTVVWSFKRFTILWLMTQGGPGNASETMVIYLYRWAFRYYDRNYAAAVGAVMFVIVTAISVLYHFYRKRSVQALG